VACDGMMTMNPNPTGYPALQQHANPMLSSPAGYPVTSQGIIHGTFHLNPYPQATTPHVYHPVHHQQPQQHHLHQHPLHQQSSFAPMAVHANAGGSLIQSTVPQPSSSGKFPSRQAPKHPFEIILVMSTVGHVNGCS
jgi:hypothetical protein